MGTEWCQCLVDSVYVTRLEQRVIVTSKKFIRLFQAPPICNIIIY